MGLRHGWSSLVLVVLGCGPNVEGTSGGATGSSTATETTGPDGTSSGDPDPSRGSSTSAAETSSSTTAAADGTTTGEGSSSTGEFVCPPRNLPETESPWWRVLIDGRIAYPPPEAAECTFVGLGLPETPGTEFELSCVLEGEEVVMLLQSALELDPNPLSPGMALTWTAQTETCCPDADRNLMALRDEGDTLVLGAFGGWNPTVEAGSILGPVTFEMVRDVCRPCDTIGCVSRGALDFASDETGSVRVYDGTSADVPGYQVTAVRVADGADGIGAPDATASVIILRQP